MTNPLLHLDFEIPFDRISAQHVVPGITALIERVREDIARIGSDDTTPRTYDNTLGALESATEKLERAMSVVGHLESTATSDALRKAYSEVLPQVSELYSSIPLDEHLFRALRSFAETEEVKSLSPTRKRFLEKTMREFVRHGAELDAAGKARLKEIDVALANATTRFSQNVLDDTNAFELTITDEAQLAGLPEHAVNAARASAKAKNLDGWRFTLHAPSLIAALTYLEDSAIRETMWRAYNTRSSPSSSNAARNNSPLIREIVKLRREKARLLGYSSFADLVLEERMAKTGQQARDFVDDLRARTEPAFAREQQELLAFRRSQEGTDAAELAPWDVAFYAERQRKALFDYDAEALRPYFSADQVMEGLFSVVSSLYGVRIEPWPGAPTWDPAVRTYRIVDASGIWIGSFYVDLYPRENKKGGAWMNSFITGGPRQAADASNQHGFAPHLGLFCANVSPPVDGAPALLTHREVQTLFHEFGHLMHHCLSTVDVRSLAGTSVAWDFVELPSQIMENWTFHPEALNLFAKHHTTGDPIPDELVQKLNRARTFREASAMMRQLGFAHADLTLHEDYDLESDDPARADPVAFAREAMSPFAPAPLPEDFAMICSFGHLFASPVGYATGYYSYKWAEVLDADAFSRFDREGVLNREVGEAFRSTILARGDSDDPAQLFRDFMGRDPDPEALLKRSGLL